MLLVDGAARLRLGTTRRSSLHWERWGTLRAIGAAAPFDLLEGDAPSAPTFAAEPPLSSLPMEFGLDAGLDFWAGREGVAEEFFEFVENRLWVGDEVGERNLQ